MKKIALFICFALLLCGCAAPEKTETEALSEELLAVSVPAPQPETAAGSPEETTLPDVLDLDEKEQRLLLKIGMAERGDTECPECIALVMCTVLNRVESDQFADTIADVLNTKDQFTPVADGTFYRAVPNESCYEALEMVIKGWDESQGALFYEFCEGESWHSKNLELLTEHCDTRFYK